MKARTALSTRRVLFWLIGTILSIHILLVLTTWQCSDTSTDSSPRTRSSKLPWLFGHTTCQQSQVEAEATQHLVDDSFLGGNGTARQRPYAYVFCITSVHNLCTALINVIRLRKLHTFAVSVVAELVLPTATHTT